jgi:hypothetical protein
MDGLNSKEIIIYSIVGILLLGIIGFAVWYFTIRPLSLPTSSLVSQAKLVGALNTNSNTELEANIDTFFDTEKDMFCSHIFFGNDDKYAYTWMQCGKYIYGEDGIVVSVEGSSVPTRFEYEKETLKVIASKQPVEGETYSLTLAQIFPVEVVKIMKEPTEEEIAELEEKTIAKFLETQDVVPSEGASTEEQE